MHEDQLAAPVGVLLEEPLNRLQLELDALEQVHVVHPDQHRLVLELRLRDWKHSNSISECA